MNGLSLAAFRPVHTDDLVRVGSAHDGGYVINERCLAHARVLVGLGISTNWDFEEDFQRRSAGCRVIGIDYSVSPARFRLRGMRYHLKALWYYATGRPSKAAARLARGRHLVGLAGRFRQFFEKRDNLFLQRRFGTRETGLSVAWGARTLVSALGTGVPDHTVFAKVDIEESEYATLQSILRDAQQICGIAVEFHDCGNRWEELLALMRACERDFVVVHVHGNNYSTLVPGTNLPRTLEVTFLNRALLSGPPTPSEATYPRPGLDAPNDPQEPDYVIEF